MVIKEKMTEIQLSTVYIASWQNNSRSVLLAVLKGLRLSRIEARWIHDIISNCLGDSNAKSNRFTYLCSEEAIQNNNKSLFPTFGRKYTHEAPLLQTVRRLRSHSPGQREALVLCSSQVTLKCMLGGTNWHSGSSTGSRETYTLQYAYFTSVYVRGSESST